MLTQSTLSTAFTHKRHELGLSLRDCEKLIGASTSTLGRFERGEQADIDTQAAINDWVGCDTDAIRLYPTDMISAICEVIQNDPKLTQEAADGLCLLIRSGYEAMRK
jgi:transcriptional regulator with XRE-family HTH domain